MGTPRPLQYSSFFVIVGRFGVSLGGEYDKVENGGNSRHATGTTFHPRFLCATKNSDPHVLCQLQLLVTTTDRDGTTIEVRKKNHWSLSLLLLLLVSFPFSTRTTRAATAFSKKYPCFLT